MSLDVDMWDVASRIIWGCTFIYSVLNGEFLSKTQSPTKEPSSLLIIESGYFPKYVKLYL